MVANDATRPSVAGQASNAGATAVEWHTALGQLLNGSDAGVVSLIDSGTRVDWSPLFTPAALDFESASDEVWVHRVWDTVRQVVSNQVAVDVVTVNPTGFELKFYNPNQIVDHNVTPRTFNGSPYVTYRVTQGATSKTLQFTKEIRDVTSANLNPPIARTEMMSLAQTQTWPNFVWTRFPWTVQGSASVNETVAQSAGNATLRTSESIALKAPGLPATTVLESSRTYLNIAGVGEAIAVEQVGSGSNALQSTYDYYNASGNPGNLGYLKSAIYADGGWDAYEYNDPGTTLTTRAGTISRRFRPFVNSPSTPGFSPTVGEVTEYDYVNDEFGAQRAPSLITTKINNVAVAKTSFAYTYEVRYANNHGVNRIERTDFTGSTASLTTVICVYMLNWGDSIYRGELFSVTTPDNVRQSFAYEKGTWNESTGTFTAGPGNASRVTQITGSATSGTGTYAQTYNSQEIESVYLVDGKSVAQTTIRDNRAQVVRQETAVWSGGAWRQTGWTNFTYNFAGELISRVSSNGAQYSATYVGGLKVSETNEQGVTTTYTHDSAGRVETATRQGSGVIGTLVFKYTYDAAGNRTEERVGWGQSEQIVATAQFDTAGRITSESQPGAGTTTHAYNVANRTHTITKASGATVVQTLNVDGRITSVTGAGVVPVYHTYGVESSSGQRYAQLNSGTSSSPRWSKRWVDWMGRQVKTQHPGYTGQDAVTQEFLYDAVGRLTRATRTGYAAQLFEYNTLSQLKRAGLDVDGNNSLDLASSDRITESDTYLDSYNSAYWLRTDRKVYAQLGLSTVTQLSTSRYRLTNFPTNRLAEVLNTDAEGNTTTIQFTVDRTARTATRTESRSGITGTRTTNYVNGFPRSVTGFDGLSTTWGYDSLLRQTTVQDSRSNTTTTAYVTGTMRPLTVTDAANGQVVLGYDSAGRLVSRRDQRNHYIRYAYNARDQLHREWGDGTYPVEYGYDTTYGDLTTISTFRGGSGWEGATWPTSPGSADTTTMAYDGPSGLLTSKTDALGRAVTQTYNLRGQTAVRTLARGVTATYGYNGATGELTSIDYSDSTPDVSFSHTRLGQLDTATDVTGTRDFVYDSAKPWRLASEALSGFYNNKVLTRMYEGAGVIGRNDGFKLGSAVGSSSDLEQDYGYFSNGRFETVATKVNSNAVTRTFRYAYLNNAALVSSLSIDGAHPFNVTRTYEPTRDLVTSVASKWSTATRTQFDYAYDERRMRKSVVQSGDAFTDYGDATHRIFTYNGRGELTADIGYLNSDPNSQAQPLPGRRYEFAFDTIGNRQSSNRTGLPGLAEAYATNALNQYVSRENNTVVASGTANADTKVAVKGQSAQAGRQGRYWSDEVVVNNALRPWHGNLTIYTAKPGAGTGGNDLYRSDVRTASIAAALQSFTYDHDGNMTSDGVWDYSYDAENRLVSMQTTSLAASYGFPNRLLEFRYDYASRRVQKRVVDLGTNTEISSRRFVYDGNNLVAEWNAPGGTTLGSLVRTYTWGIDVTRSVHRAGGIGGLLEIRDYASAKAYLPTYDGNGNVVSLINANSGTTAAAYEYSAFGETIRAHVQDMVIADQPLRYSTKYHDLETGLVYFGRRYYHPGLGRWLSRDPIGERGGFNIYGFVRSNPMQFVDPLGLNLINIQGLFGWTHTTAHTGQIAQATAQMVQMGVPITTASEFATNVGANATYAMELERAAENTAWSLLGVGAIASPAVIGRFAAGGIFDAGIQLLNGAEFEDLSYGSMAVGGIANAAGYSVVPLARNAWSGYSVVRSAGSMTSDFAAAHALTNGSLQIAGSAGVMAVISEAKDIASATEAFTNETLSAYGSNQIQPFLGTDPVSSLVTGVPMNSSQSYFDSVATTALLDTSAGFAAGTAFDAASAISFNVANEATMASLANSDSLSMVYDNIDAAATATQDVATSDVSSLEIYADGSVRVVVQTDE